MSGEDAEHVRSYTDTFRPPPDTTKLIHITRYSFVTGRKAVLCESTGKMLHCRPAGYVGYSAGKLTLTELPLFTYKCIYSVIQKFMHSRNKLHSLSVECFTCCFIIKR